MAGGILLLRYRSGKKGQNEEIIYFAANERQDR